jgi:hypothetical protein
LRLLIGIGLNTLTPISSALQNGAEVKPGKDQRIFAMGRKRFLQIMKGVVGDSAQYTCDAADTSTSCTIEIYGKSNSLWPK